MREILRFVFFVAFAFFGLMGKGQVIYTVAGSNNVGENVYATLSLLSFISDVTIDASGNVYITDQGNNIIRKINTSGIITTIAGTGIAGFSGDGGLATIAQLNQPTSMCIDVNGNVFIADYNNNRVRKINTSGIITTIAGTGTAGFSGDGGQATAAQFNSPVDVRTDVAGNLYVADFNNHCIRKVNSTGVINTIAGTGTSGFSGDGGVATLAKLNSPGSVNTDAAGNVYITDTHNNRVRKIDVSGKINTIAGTGTAGFSGDGGLAVSAKLSSPIGVSVDASGNVFIADLNNNRIRKIDATGNIVTVAGNGIAGYSGDGGSGKVAQLFNPIAVEADVAGNVYIGDLSNCRIRVINAAGNINTVAGNGSVGFYGENVLTNSAHLYSPSGVAFDATGNMYIADHLNNRIRKVDNFGVITTIAGTGSGGFSGDGGPAIAAKIYEPWGIAVDDNNNIYVADNQYRIRKISAAGIISTVAGNGIEGYSGDGGPAIAAQINNLFTGIAVDKTGNVYIADKNNNRIRKIDTLGIITTIAGGGTNPDGMDSIPASTTALDWPNNIKINNSGNIYFLDAGGHSLRKIDTTGMISTIADASGDPGFTGDGGKAIDAKITAEDLAIDNIGNVYIVDNGTRIRKIDTTGIINTIAGTGANGYGGDGGSAKLAQINSAWGIAIDAADNVYVADNSNNRIRKICIAAQPATTKSADSSNTTTIFDINNTIALHSGCNAIANFTPNGTSPVLGPISSQVWLDATQNTGYVKRHYQITPSVNPTTSTATVTLFFTQTDFDDFNAVNTVKLPQNPTDAAGKANFKIEKRSGVSFDATGSPSSYNGTVVIIDPDDSNIVWNNALSRWEVSFNVTGFSGFFAKTSAAVLPVHWLSVNGKLNNNQSAEINWLVEEQNVLNYNVEKSTDGANFQIIGTLNSVGTGRHNYSFTENQALIGKAIYRIKQIDVDGHFDYSQAVYLGTTGKIILYPNPAKENATLFSSQQMLGSRAYLYDLQGKLLQQISIQQNVQSIDLSRLVTGIYLLKLGTGQTMKLVKE